MKNKPILFLYFLTCLVYLFANYQSNTELMLLSKPVIVPAIFFYYINEEKYKFNWNYVAITVFFYVADMIVLIDYNDVFLQILLLNLFSYLMYLKVTIDNLVTLRIHFINKAYIGALFIFSFFLMFLLVSAMDIMIESKTNYIWLVFIYGIVLVFIGVTSALNYIIFPSRNTTFMVVTSLLFVISDVFFILKKDFSEFEIFDYLNGATQVFSYYFLTKYFLLKK